MGLRLDDLGTRRLSWRDLLVIVRQSPTGSALDRAMNPTESAWGLTEHLLATVIDQLRVSDWRAIGDKRNPFPDPIPRPGVESTKKTHGKASLSIEDFEAQRRVRQEGATS